MTLSLLPCCLSDSFYCIRIWDSPKDEIRNQATPALAKIKEDILVIQQELQGHAYWKYEPAFSPGLQGLPPPTMINMLILFCSSQNS